jgi:hypothetical protein
VIIIEMEEVEIEEVEIEEVKIEEVEVKIEEVEVKIEEVEIEIEIEDIMTDIGQGVEIDADLDRVLLIRTLKEIMDGIAQMQNVSIIVMDTI